MSYLRFPTLFVAGYFMISAALAQTYFIPSDPTGDAFSPSWNYVYNEGQTYDLDGTFSDETITQSVGTNPTVFAMTDARIVLTSILPDTVLPDTTYLARLDIQMIGEDVQQPDVVLLNNLEGHYNFYEEFTPEGIENVGIGKRVILYETYKDIDVHLISNAYGPKFQFVVRPGGDPEEILLSFTGQDSMHVDVEGFLRLYFGQRYIRLHQCIAYQQIGQTTSYVNWVPHYEHVEGSTLVSVQVGSYNPNYPLIFAITPFNPLEELEGMGGSLSHPEWGTFVRGSGSDGIRDICRDDDGYVYYTGFSSSSSGLPATAGLIAYQLEEDAIVGRLNEFYEMEVLGTWMTYIGAGDKDYGNGIAYDPVNDRVVMAGSSAALLGGQSITNFPLNMNPNCYQGDGSGMICFFNASDGFRTYASQMMGSFVELKDVSLDADGNVYAVGDGANWNFDWITVDPLGPDDYFFDGGPENGFSIRRGVILKLTASADLVWCTVLGGPMDDWLSACHVDQVTERLYVTGSTSTRNIQTVIDCSQWAGNSEFQLCDFGGWFQDKLNGPTNIEDGRYDGTITGFDLTDLSMFWSTYFGGNGDADEVQDVTTDGDGNIYITGVTDTYPYLTAQCVWDGSEAFFANCDNSGYHAPYGGLWENYVAKFDASTTLVWSSFIGSSHEEGTAGRARIALDEAENVLVFGTTTSHSAITTPLPVSQGGLGHYFQPLNGDGVVPSTGPADTYLFVFDPAGVHVHSSYYGDNGSDVSGGLTAFDGRVYVAGTSLALSSMPFHCPTIPGHTPYCEDVADGIPGNSDGYISQLRYDLTAGMEDVHDDDDVAGLLVYPNPSSAVVTLASTADLRGARIVLYDAMGRAVLIENVPHSCLSWDFDLSSLARGCYTLHLEGKNGPGRARFVKQ